MTEEADGTWTVNDRTKNKSRSYDAFIGYRGAATIVRELRNGRLVISARRGGSRVPGQGIASALAHFPLDDLAAGGGT